MRSLLYLAGLFIVILCESVALARDAYSISIGPSGWSTLHGVGLIGPSVEIELREESASIEALWGLGARCAMSWALWPRLYLEGANVLWRPFGEVGFAQAGQDQIRVDSHCGPLLERRETWKFFGAGLGVAYRRYDRVLRLSMGVGVATGQCPACDMQIYVALRVGHFF